MKVVILAGGAGTRIGEETVTRPKPIIENRGNPLLRNFMKEYSAIGLHEFIVWLGHIE